MIGGIQMAFYIKNMDIELYMMQLVTSMPRSQVSYRERTGFGNLQDQKI